MCKVPLGLDQGFCIRTSIDEASTRGTPCRCMNVPAVSNTVLENSAKGSRTPGTEVT